MYILLEWLTYQHVVVKLACVTIGARLPRDMMQQDSVCVVIPPFFIHLLGAFTLSWPHLPVDTTLSGSGDTISHMSTKLPVIQYPPPMKSSTVVVAEGIPPVPCHLVEKVRKWEYINLADLLKDHNSSDQFIIINGQVLSISDQKPRSSNRVIADIFTWLQAYNIFTAILLSAEDTTKEEAADLVVHSYLILQMSKDLQGLQWLQYNQTFREWAAEKGICKWGELNFSIYGCCLATQQPTLPKLQTSKQKRKSDVNVCFHWNDGISCNESSCHYSHRCRYCAGVHRAIDCPLKPKRP